MPSSVDYAPQEIRWAFNTQSEARKLLCDSCQANREIASMRLGAVVLVMALAVCSSAVIGGSIHHPTFTCKSSTMVLKECTLHNEAHYDSIAALLLVTYG